MSLTREDWRSFSAIVQQYVDMELDGPTSTRERELRQMLAVWLRDHDMPQRVLEDVGRCHYEYFRCGDGPRPLRATIDQINGEVVTLEMTWKYYETSTPGSFRSVTSVEFTLLAGRTKAGEYYIEARV